jgi:hypothetical protein
MKADARALSVVLKAMRSQNDEAFARPTEDGGMQLYCVRPDGVTICSAVMHKEAFPEGTDGMPGEFMVEIDRWAKALATVGPDADIDFPDGRVVLSGKGLRHTFRLVDVKDQRNKFRMPDLSERLTGECMVEAERVRTLLTSVDEKKVTDLKAVIGPEGLALSAYDDTGDGVDLTVRPDECALVEGRGSGLFSREAWADIMKALPADAVTDIRLGENVPVVMDYGDKVFDLTWLCAPYIMKEE